MGALARTAVGAATAPPMATERRSNDTAERVSLQNQIDAAVKQKDFTTASRLQQLLDALHAPPEGTLNNATGRAPAEIAQEIETVPFDSLIGPLRGKRVVVNLEKVRILSCSKIIDVPVRPAKSEVRSERKGKGKGKGKGKEKGKEAQSTEPSLSAFIGGGDEGRVICLLAFGDCVEILRPYIDQNYPLVNCCAVERRPGKTELFLTKESVLTTCLKPTDRDAPRTFPYKVDHLATKTTISQAMMHSFVDLVLRAYAVEERATADGDPYLILSGQDMDGEDFGPLRLWQYEDGDVVDGIIYIFRGLKAEHR